MENQKISRERMDNQQLMGNSAQGENDLLEKISRLPINSRENMDKQQLLDNLTEAENDLFEIMGRVENILGFFQKSLEQKNYDLEETTLPQNTSNFILNLRRKLTGICRNLPAEVPTQNPGKYLEKFKEANLMRVLRESGNEIKRLSSNEIPENNNENDEDLFI
jgi:hypothetical protein